MEKSVPVFFCFGKMTGESVRRTADLEIKNKNCAYSLILNV